MLCGTPPTAPLPRVLFQGKERSVTFHPLNPAAAQGQGPVLSCLFGFSQPLDAF